MALHAQVEVYIGHVDREPELAVVLLVMRVVANGAHDPDPLRVFHFLEVNVIDAPRLERAAPPVANQAAVPITILGAIRALSVPGQGPLLDEGLVTGCVSTMALSTAIRQFNPDGNRREWL
jgi:hypothetical protein